MNVRERFESDQIAYATHLITHGVGYADEANPTFDADEREEITRLAPEITRTVRRECGRVERRLRRQHPEVVPLLDPPIETYLTGEYAAAVDTLTPPRGPRWAP